jgi:hypothetical protein
VYDWKTTGQPARLSETKTHYLDESYQTSAGRRRLRRTCLAQLCWARTRILGPHERRQQAARLSELWQNKTPAQNTVKAKPAAKPATEVTATCATCGCSAKKV